MGNYSKNRASHLSGLYIFLIILKFRFLRTLKFFIWLFLLSKTHGSTTYRTHGSTTYRTHGSTTYRTDGSTTYRTDGSTTYRTDGSTTYRTYGSTTNRTHGSTTNRTHGSTTYRTYGSTTYRTHGSTTYRTHGSTTYRPVVAKRIVSNGCVLQGTSSLVWGLSLDFCKQDDSDPSSVCVISFILG